MRKPLFIVATATAGVLALAGCSAAPATGATSAPVSAAAMSTTTTPSAGSAAPAGTITAQGTGTVTGTPDLVTVTLGVQTRSPSAKAALDDNNTKAAAVIAILKKNGVAPADLQTSDLSVSPNYDTNGQNITGYQVSNMVTAKLRKLDTAGALIDAVGQAAGNAVRVQQLSFSIDNDSALRATARADAVKQAQAQAKQMADAAGVQLGQVRSITETPVANSTKYDVAATASTAGASVPIEAGSQDLSVVVQVVYDIAR